MATILATAMINIFVTVSVPEQNLPAILPLLEQLTAASQKEEGCLRYQYYLHPNDPTQLVIVERWRDQAALDSHEKTEHYTTTLLPKIAGLASSIDIDKF